MKKIGICSLILLSFLFLELTLSQPVHADSDKGITLSSTLQEIKVLAEQGDAEAQHELGVIFEDGRKGVISNNAEALKWYRKSAEQGYTWGQYHLGEMYKKGNGVTRDYVEAVKWYIKSAEQGFAYAQADLGEMYEEGHGVPRDYVLGYMWFSLAAAQGYSFAERRLDLIEKKMTSQQIAEAQGLSREFKAK